MKISTKILFKVIQGLRHLSWIVLFNLSSEKYFNPIVILFYEKRKKEGRLPTSQKDDKKV